LDDVLGVGPVVHHLVGIAEGIALVGSEQVVE